MAKRAQNDAGFAGVGSRPRKRRVELWDDLLLRHKDNGQRDHQFGHLESLRGFAGSMSKDSSATYIHLHSSSHADLFEEFCRPPSSIPSSASSNANPSHPQNTTSSSTQQSQGANNPSDPSSTTLPGHYLPFDDIHLPEHLMPSNPEDEDDVVPQGHAAWGIVRAMQLHTQQQQQQATAGGGGGLGGGEAGEGGAGAGQAVERWRDLGLEGLLRGWGNGNGNGNGVGIGNVDRRSARGLNGVGVGGWRGSRVGGGRNGAAREGFRRGRMLLR